MTAGQHTVHVRTETLPVIASWARGANAERALSDKLDHVRAIGGVTLHGRAIPGAGSIDHIVVARSGVWLIDAQRECGRVEQRDVGGWSKYELRLFVGGHDRSALISDMDWKAQAVARQLHEIGIDHLPIHTVLCFTNAEWGSFGKPFALDGVWIMWGSALIERIAAPGPLDAVSIASVANELSFKMAAAGAAAS